MRADSRLLGRRGEDAAARWYEARGFEVLHRNWRCSAGELDLVVGRPGLVVFCEVKTRSSARFGLPAEAVTPSKQARLRRLAGHWLAAHPVAGERDVRIDVAAVMGLKVDVLEGVV